MDVIIMLGVGLILLLIIMGGAVALYSKFYKKVAQGQALIISTLSEEPTVTFTGGFVWPIIHKAEFIDLSVKRIDIDRRQKNGLICKDFLRADINVNFFVKINNTRENILEVAQTVGCERASDVNALDELFSAKFSEALKTAGKRFEFQELFDNRDGFRDQVKEVIGRDLNGFVLEDVAIDYLEQTDREFMNENDTNDAKGIEKIVSITAEKKVAETEKQNDADARIAQLHVRKLEQIKQAEREEAKLVEQTELAKQEARIQREREVAAKELTKNKEIELQRKNDEAEILAAEQAKMRRAEAAEKDRQKALIIKKEENLAEQMRLEKQRQEEEVLLELQRQTKAEQEAAKLKEAEGLKMEADERNQTKVEQEIAERTKITEVIAAQAAAEKMRIEEEEKAEARKKVAEVEAEQATFDFKKTEVEAQSQRERAEAQAFERERLADAQAKEFAATEMAKVQVERENLKVREEQVVVKDKELNLLDKQGAIDAENKKRMGDAEAATIRSEGKAKADNTKDLGTAEAEQLKQKGLAAADVEARNVDNVERANEVEASRIRQIKLAEAEGLSKLADAQKMMDSISQEREEFRLKLEKQTEIELARSAVSKDIASAQAGVLGEAFKSTDIKIIGGDGDFFDRFVKSASMGQALDGMVQNSQTIQALSNDYLEGDANLVQEVSQVLSSPALGATNMRDLSITAVLTALMRDASGERKQQLEALLQAAQKFTDTNND